MPPCFFSRSRAFRISVGRQDAICQQIGVIENTLLDGMPEESRSMLRDLLRRMYDNLK